MFNAAVKVVAQQRRVVWVTPAVNLYVVGVLVRRQTLSLDDADNVEQERAQYGPLRNAKLDDGRCRLLATVTHVLTTYERNHDRTASFRPNEVRRRLIRMVWSTVSNAADRSISRARADMSHASNVRHDSSEYGGGLGGPEGSVGSLPV